MMKVMKFTFVLALAIAAVVIAEPTKEKPWLDMQNCVFCKEFSSQPGLMEHSRMENHNLKNGILGIWYIDKGYEEKCNMAMAAAKKVGEEMMKSGKPMTTCGHCDAYGSYMMNPNVSFNEVATPNAHFWILTSTDPAIVSDLQVFGKKNIDEMKKMKAEPKKMGSKE